MPKKSSKPLNSINDSAKGPIAGTIFQFEFALLLLSDLENPKDSISLENVDDVAVHNKDGAVLITVQAKHSIITCGKTLEDTSYALWRTFEIWTMKLEMGLFNDDTEFVCVTNKKIADTSLLSKIVSLSFEEVIAEFEKLIKIEEEKLRKKRSKTPAKGNSITQIIALINLILFKRDYFSKVKQKIKVKDNLDIKAAFLNKIYAGTERITDLQRDSIYEAFCGWIISGSKARWLNGAEAKFTKENFDSKYYLVMNTPSIINAIFRTKNSFRILEEEEIESKQDEIFVKQIEDLDWRREVKERKIKEAIIEYVYHDIELKHVVEKGDYTKQDFDTFLDECKSAWQIIFDRHFALELEKYSNDERNAIAIKIFEAVMYDIKIEFSGNLCFTTNNSYMRNGCFLRLSNIPEIGWHPEWEGKYKSQ